MTDVATIPANPSTAFSADELERFCRVLSTLMTNRVTSATDNGLPEPLQAIIDKLKALPPCDRFESLGNQLAGIPGLEIDAIVERVFAIDPRDPESESPPDSAFPFPPIYTGKHETKSLEEPLSHSAPVTSPSRRSFQAPENDETDPSALTAVSLTEFLEVQDTEQEWCVDRLFPMEGASILASPGGWGKSWMLLDLAIETARGGRWLGRFPTQKLKVLYVDEESSPRLLRRRYRKLLKAKNLRSEGVEIHLVVGEGFSLSNPKSVAGLKRLLDEHRPGLVIFDSLIRVHEAEENSATEMAKVFAVLKDLIRLSKAAFVIADHQRKPGHASGSLDTLLRGSSEKKAFVDCLLSMQKKDNALIVEHSKSRHDVEIPDFVVRIEDPATGGTVVQCTGDAEEVKTAAIRNQVEEFLRIVIPKGEWVVRKALVARAKDEGISTRNLDETLKSLVGTDSMDRDDRVPDEGPRRKQAHFRWKDDATSFHVGEAPETMFGEDNQMDINDLHGG